ncbi:hypothetical protein HanXRQr2_Chr17g0787881 [Helianthus annuus]|uniref:Uncharacterized protein n=1 Tax=Helianthus annuus TaxID=4232 RepID=A0A9K3GTE4_HELAN|nr:hypothetical protein HanXRQr2_Chr17g0787881 [Helianthus annuus]
MVKLANKPSYVSNVLPSSSGTTSSSSPSFSYLQEPILSTNLELVGSLSVKDMFQ